MSILKIVAILLGSSDCTHCVDDYKPTDMSGQTSIVVILGHKDSGNWVELRGPGRYEALEAWLPYEHLED
jgi:hypothetical protein